MKTIKDFEKCYGYKDIKDKLCVYGIWHVTGEDPNCDFGGSHHQPTLGYFEGVLSDVVEYAVNLPCFWQWGAGGNFELVEVVKVDNKTAIRMVEMKAEKESLEERLAAVKRALGEK